MAIDSTSSQLAGTNSLPPRPHDVPLRFHAQPLATTTPHYTATAASWPRLRIADHSPRTFLVSIHPARLKYGQLSFGANGMLQVAISASSAGFWDPCGTRGLRMNESTHSCRTAVTRRQKPLADIFRDTFTVPRSKRQSVSPGRPHRQIHRRS